MAKKRPILYAAANDNEGMLVTAIDAPKGEAYFCPECSGKMTLRRSGNTEPNSKRPHFAHKALDANCTPESVLHFGFKTLAYRFLTQRLSARQELEISWDCHLCQGQHSGRSLIKRARAVRLEFSLGPCIPDIALMDENNEVFAAIEIVVSHAPETATLAYYEENNIALVQYRLTTEADLFNVEHRLSMPDYVDVCPNPKCKHCGQHMGERRLLIVDSECYACKSAMKIAVGFGAPNSPGLYKDVNPKGPVFTPREFNAQEVQIARDAGVDIRKAHKGVRDFTDNACHCPNCDRWRGTTHLYEIAKDAQRGNQNYEYRTVGYECTRWDCDKGEPW